MPIKLPRSRAGSPMPESHPTKLDELLLESNMLAMKACDDPFAEDVAETLAKLSLVQAKISVITNPTRN